jgi:hypothetical protein
LIGGAYVNGGIMPLVGGELAKAAFDHGYEEYGVDILKRYHALVSERCETYLWYFPDGTPASIEKSTSPDAQPTDGWGSSAMLYALLSGLAGVEDLGKSFERVRLAPRWPAADVYEAEVQTTYESSGAALRYDYRLSAASIEMVVSAPAEEVQFHVLLPPGSEPGGVSVNGAEVAFQPVQVEDSRYVDFKFRVADEARVVVKLVGR